MITDIVQPNFTYVASLQGLWALSDLACGRPSSNINIPIICTTSGIGVKDPWIIDQGTDYNMQSRCCPTRSFDNWVTFRTNSTNSSFFSARSDCPANYCYLSDEGTAHDFGSCIEEASRDLVEKGRREGTLRNNATTARKFNGTCEYIDYENLWKREQIPTSCKTSDASQVIIWSLKVMMGLVGMGLCVAGSGLF